MDYLSQKVETGNLKSWFGFCGILADKLKLYYEIIPFMRATELHILSMHTSDHPHVKMQFACREKLLHWVTSSQFFSCAAVMPCYLGNICYLLVTQFPYLKITMLMPFFHCTEFKVMLWKRNFKIAITYVTLTDRKQERHIPGCRLI